MRIAPRVIIHEPGKYCPTVPDVPVVPPTVGSGWVLAAVVSEFCDAVLPSVVVVAVVGGFGRSELLSDLMYCARGVAPCGSAQRIAAEVFSIKNPEFQAYWLTIS